MYFLLAIAPILSYLLYTSDAVSVVNVEMLNGLVTGSSILFGFAVLPIGKRKMERLLWVMIFLDVFALMVTGLLYFRFALGQNVGVFALVVTAMSFNMNAVTALFRHDMAGEAMT